MVGVDGAGGVPEVEAGVWVRVGGDEGEGVILPGLLVVGGISLLHLSLILITVKSNHLNMSVECVCVEIV